MYSTLEYIYQQFKNSPDELVNKLGNFIKYLMKKYQFYIKSSETAVTLELFKGMLKNLLSFQDEPLKIQVRMRNKWKEDEHAGLLNDIAGGHR